jgi:hypothetical protein
MQHLQKIPMVIPQPHSGAWELINRSWGTRPRALIVQNAMRSPTPFTSKDMWTQISPQSCTSVPWQERKAQIPFGMAAPVPMCIAMVQPSVDRILIRYGPLLMVHKQPAEHATGYPHMVTGEAVNSVIRVLLIPTQRSSTGTCI